MRLIILSLLLASCASTRNYHENGKKYYESGMYHKAMEEYQLGLKLKPADPDLNIGLKKSQDKIYEIELLKVRDTRIGGDPLTALNKIRELDQKMTKWNIHSDVNGSEFRKTEIEKLLVNLKSYLMSDLDKGFVLKTHKVFTSYKDLLGPLDGYQPFENEIIQKGKEKCLKITVDQKFYNLFTSKYCEYFGENHNIVINVDDQLYSFDNATFVIDNTRMPASNYIANTRLYNPNGRNKIKSLSNIKFKYDERKSTPTKVKDYQDTESYWDTETETYWVNESYRTMEMQCNYLNTYNPCQMVNVTKTRTVPRYRDKKVRKTRRVSKTYSYKVNQVNQSLVLYGQSEIYIGGQKVIINHNISDFYSDYEHNESSSLKGLSPKSLALREVVSWKNTLIQRVLSDLNYQVQANWRSQYCKKTGDLKMQGEYMMRCALIAPDSDPFLNEWSQNFSGLAYSEMKTLLKI